MMQLDEKNNRDLLTSQRLALAEMLITTVMRDTSPMLTLSVLFLSGVVNQNRWSFLLAD